MVRLSFVCGVVVVHWWCEGGAFELHLLCGGATFLVLCTRSVGTGDAYWDASALILTATRVLALRALGLRATSSSEATRGFRVLTSSIGTLPQTHTGRSGGQVQPRDISEKTCLTMRSSRLW